METINWKELPFAYHKTDCNSRSYWKNGAWSAPEFSDSEYMPIHIAATSLHYGQQVFEGLKAFMGKDGKIRVFRLEENAKRMHDSCLGIQMEPPTTELFKEMVFETIRRNRKYVPPYGTGASLYIRPLTIGTGARVGVRPADEYMFLVFVSPVGPYFKEGFSPVSFMVTRDYDRAAPKGTGRYKVGGNYAASLTSMHIAHEKGFANVLFLDAKEKKYIDECGPANFFGIKNNTYITPKSESILPSITNKSLVQLAEHLGMKTEIRPILLEELDTFEEAGACGTAAVISPIKRIFDDSNGKVYNFGETAGPLSTKLYLTLRDIQNGDAEDVFGWNSFVD